MAASRNRSDYSGRRPNSARPLFTVRVVLILHLTVVIGCIVGWLVTAAGHGIAEAILAGLSAAGAAMVYSHKLIA